MMATLIADKEEEEEEKDQKNEHMTYWHFELHSQ